MTIFGHRPALRWLVPILVALALSVAGSTVGLVTASARDGLPQRSASQLLTDVTTARVTGLSGTIRQTADLGLPALPGTGQGNSSELSSLVSGSHTLRLWYAGPSQVRLALLGSLGESDVIRNGRDLWTWSSTKRSVTHRTVPLPQRHAPGGLGATPAMTPQQAADFALQGLSSSTKVSVGRTAVVAGRSAYEMVLQPRNTGSLVGSVRIALDGEAHVPVRVQVFATSGSAPAFEVGFTSLDLTTPDPAVFAFTPPPGATVTESESPTPKSPKASVGLMASIGTSFGARSGHAPKIVGSGWASVVVAKIPSVHSSGANSLANPLANPLAKALTTLPQVSGSWGTGHLLRGTLFSALLTTDGHLVVGAVPPAELYAALAR